ncbi:MAG: hypothetical protein IKT20_00980 [Clostridiales bacterium]|nr:hypothetical protein [Clostridiales bacterium]
MKFVPSRVRNIRVKDVDGISLRTANSLARAGFETVGDVVDRLDTRQKIDSIRGLGVISRDEIEGSISKIYPGYLGMNLDKHEIEMSQEALIEKLQKQIEWQKDMIEIYKKDIKNLQVDNDQLRELLAIERNKTTQE